MSVLTLFLEGLLSFLSPCVLPLVPLYVSYLTQDTKIEDEDGNVSYDRRKTFLLTLGFVLGISTVFFLIGLGSRLLNAIFEKYTIHFQIGGGILLIIFGLLSSGVIKVSFFNKTLRKGINTSGSISFVKAWSLGFFFSFAWSPCVGPLLAQAMFMAAQQDKVTGWLYIGAYTLGFVIIFLLMGLFTQTVLNFLKKSKNVVKYTGMIATVVVIGMGCYMLYQGAMGISNLQKQPQVIGQTNNENLSAIEQYDFILKDGDGNEVQLSSFKGKKVVLNFFGTWCYYCNQELPALKSIQDNRDDVQVLLVSNPRINNEGDVDYIEKYLEEAGYDFLVLHDEDHSVQKMYGVNAFPYTFVFNEDGSAKGYIPGYVPEESWNQILDN